MSYYKKDNPDGTATITDGDLRLYQAQMAFAFADHMVLANAQGSAMGDALGRMDVQPHDKPAPDSHLMPVDVIVKRACDLASALYAEMCRRDFIVKNVPPDTASGWVEL